MNKEEIIQHLTNAHHEFAEHVRSFNEKDFTFAPNNKWSAGQQIDHIVRAVFPLTLAYRFPKSLIQLLFGKANRPSKEYDVLVKKYTERLEHGGKATGPFIPNKIPFKQKEQLVNKLLKAIRTICENLNSFSEQQLDECILPHPLLGKLTMREMLYFTIYHVEHHQKVMLKNLENQKKE